MYCIRTMICATIGIEPIIRNVRFPDTPRVAILT